MQKEKTEKFATELQAWLDSYAKANDFTRIACTHITLGAGRFTCTIKAETAEQPTNAEYAGMLGLPADVVGKQVRENGKILRIVRLEPARPKNCIVLVEEGTDKTYKAPASWYHQQVRLNQLITS